MVAASKNGADAGANKVRIVSSPTWRLRLRRRTASEVLAPCTHRAFPTFSERTGDAPAESASRPQIQTRRTDSSHFPNHPLIRQLTPTYSVWNLTEPPQDDTIDKRAAAAHEQVLCRQSTVEFISSLLKGTDTPDEPLPQLFDGLPSSVNDFAALADPSHAFSLTHTHAGSTSTLGPFIDNMITEQNRKAAAERAGRARRMGPTHRVGASPPVSALKRPRGPAPTLSPVGPIGYAHEQLHAHQNQKRARRINSAPARAGPPTFYPAAVDTAHLVGHGARPRGFIDGVPTQNRQGVGVSNSVGHVSDRASPVTVMGRNAASPSASSFGGAAAAPQAAAQAAAQAAPAAKADKPKAKNPKRADRRRTIARFTTAILRAGGSNAFIARDGLGYRKAFDRFLVETYGDTFAEGGYWYENARVEPFFRVLFHIATDGRVQLDPDAVNALFCKREKRQAAEWLLDEEELSKFGVTATHLAQIFEGPPSVSPTGYPRGTPLAIPTDAELDGGAVKMSASAAAASQAAQQAAQAHQTHQHHSGHHDSHRHDQYAPHAPLAHPMYGGGGSGHHGHYGTMSQDTHGGYHGGSIPVAHTVNSGHVKEESFHAYGSHHPGHYNPHVGHPGGGPHPGHHNPYGGMDAGNGAMPGHMFPPMHMGAGGPYAHPGQHPHDPSRVHSGYGGGPVEMGMNGSGPRRQYSSDLSRLMSEFNANPSSSDDFLKSFLQRTASELDNLAQLGSK